jgi:NADPH:quinone reductase-like Zn-dependent oxidoreductase
MRAILRTMLGGPEVLIIREIPEPEPKDGHAVIAVKAFGLNHAELHMRKRGSGPRSPTSAASSSCGASWPRVGTRALWSLTPKPATSARCLTTAA